MIRYTISKHPPILLPAGNTGTSGTGTTTCPAGQCPDNMVPGYENAGNDGGMAIPGTSIPFPKPKTDTTTGTGMDIKTSPSAAGELMALLVPGLTIALLALVIYLSTQKN